MSRIFFRPVSGSIRPKARSICSFGGAWKMPLIRVFFSPMAHSRPEREIADLTELSRVTVRKAIRELVEDGSIVQRQGSGSFVRGDTPKLEQSLSQLTSFSEDMARRGLDSRSIWLERGIVLATPEEVSALELEEGESVARIRRLREAGGQPMALEQASLPLDLLPNPLEVTQSLYSVLASNGCHPVRAVQKISAINLGEAEASLLQVATGDAGLSMVRTSYLPNGRVVEFTRSTYRGDAYDFVAELSIVKTKES